MTVSRTMGKIRMRRSRIPGSRKPDLSLTEEKTGIYSVLAQIVSPLGRCNYKRHLSVQRGLKKSWVRAESAYHKPQSQEEKSKNLITEDKGITDSGGLKGGYRSLAQHLHFIR